MVASNLIRPQQQQQHHYESVIVKIGSSNNSLSSPVLSPLSYRQTPITPPMSPSISPALSMSSSILCTSQQSSPIALTTTNGSSSSSSSNSSNSSTSDTPTPVMEPVSRTYQYRKVMKPMLERKRRARINRCLDELKELIVTALQSEGENVSKLEKADILELTVRHLHRLRKQRMTTTATTASTTTTTTTNNNNSLIDADRFRAGFTYAADEVSRCLASTPGIDIHLGTKLMTHLGHRLNDLDKCQQQQQQQQQQPQHNHQHNQQNTFYSPATSPVSMDSTMFETNSNPPSPKQYITEYELVQQQQQQQHQHQYRQHQHQYHHHHNQQVQEFPENYGNSLTYNSQPKKESVWRPW